MWNLKPRMTWAGPTQVLETRHRHSQCLHNRKGPIKSQKPRPGQSLLPDQGETRKGGLKGGGSAVARETRELQSIICNVTLTPKHPPLFFLDLNWPLYQTHNKISNKNTSFLLFVFSTLSSKIYSVPKKKGCSISCQKQSGEGHLHCKSG